MIQTCLIRRGELSTNELVLLQKFETASKPASQAVMGPFALTSGSPACWTAKLARLPGVWRDAGRWRSPPVSGPQHGVHFGMQGREGSPDDETNHIRSHTCLDSGGETGILASLSKFHL